MNILITGASGFIGSALTPFLQSKGHTIKGLQRVSQATNEPWWNIRQQQIDFRGFNPDVVIHLAGENIAARRWSATRKQAIISSRTESTQLLINHLCQMTQPPQTLLSGSAIGYYGLRGDEKLTETSSVGTDFVSKVCIPWEECSHAAQQCGIRTVNLRTGIVLDPDNGALKKMLPAFQMGFGGKLGHGQQYMSWVSLHDYLNMIDFIIHNNNLNGPVNLTAPAPVRNQAFSQQLAKALKRPALLPMPAFIARLLFGEMAQELLLEGAYVYPQTLLDSGFNFKHKTLQNYLSDTFS